MNRHDRRRAMKKPKGKNLLTVRRKPRLQEGKVVGHQGNPQKVPEWIIKSHRSGRNDKKN